MSKLRPREVAQRLQAGMNFVYSLLYSGKLAAAKTEEGWQISEASLAEYIAKHSRKRADAGK